MSLQGDKTKAMFQRATKVIPHGVNSNFRYWGPDDTFVIQRGEGAYIWDVDDRRFIDYRLAFGPIILGHADPRVNQAVAEAIQGGTLFAWTTPGEVELAEKIVKMTGVDKVRLTNTGTEATMHALRIARAHTNREKFIKFEGQYHGMNDYFMYSTASSNMGMLGSRQSPIAAPATSGIPKGIGEYVIMLPFNDTEMLEKTVKARWGEIAAIFIEPMMGNAAGIMPRPEFFKTIRRLCDEYGIVMVFDEVKTGFRIANGGAQEYFKMKADLVTYAKSLGNGYPIAAIGGTEEVMMTIDPGHVAHGGTYSGNVVGVAAANATLDILAKEPVLETINKRGKALMKGIDDILTEQDIAHVVTGLPPMFSILLGIEEEPHEFRDYIAGDGELYEHIAYELIKRGVMPDADGREPWFLCAALNEKDVDETLNIFNDSVKVAKK
jgi:glutamate-1-semialdehyde 2,1-aminomutase